MKRFNLTISSFKGILPFFSLLVLAMGCSNQSSKYLAQDEKDSENNIEHYTKDECKLIRILHKYVEEGELNKVQFLKHSLQLEKQNLPAKRASSVFPAVNCACRPFLHRS